MLGLYGLTGASWSTVATRHLVLVLLVPWLVYVYRDVWPLATYYLTPADSAEGSLFWIKFSVLTIAAVIVPLVIPRRYVPYDPEVRRMGPSQEALSDDDYRILVRSPIPSKRRRYYPRWCTRSSTPSSGLETARLTLRLRSYLPSATRTA